MAERDLPAMVDYIVKSTGQEAITYIGHSQGACIGFAGFGRNKTLSRQIDLFIALAPVARIGNAKGALKLLGKIIKSDVDVRKWIYICHDGLWARVLSPYKSTHGQSVD